MPRGRAGSLGVFAWAERLAQRPPLGRRFGGNCRVEIRSNRSTAQVGKMISPNHRPFAKIVAREVRYASDQRPGASMDVTLETARLVLRPLRPEDAPTIARLAGHREIADTTLSIPHPYSVEQAQEWIATHSAPQNPTTQMVFGITTRADGQLIGTMGLREIDTQHCHAEMGFWIGMEWWGNGYATEAAKAVVRYGFAELKLNRIYAQHMVRNPASGRVLAKIGMKGEGLLRQTVRKWGVFEDVVLMAILQDDWRILEKRSE